MTKVAVLIPAHNEEESIAQTIEAVLAQTRRADLVVVIPNGCTDRTAEIARSFDGVVVEELPRLPHRKSQALNIAWKKYASDADIVIAHDADTVLHHEAIEHWVAEFEANSGLGGSVCRFTVRGGGYLTRMQRAEYSRFIDTALRRGETAVLSGAGCALSGLALYDVVVATGRPGPWSYDSQVEDFELTYQLRKLGYRCTVSPKVRAYTDSMRRVQALWNQRIRWQTGTVEDLMRFGFNHLTWRDWFSQGVGVIGMIAHMLTLVIVPAMAATGTLAVGWWWPAVMAVVIASEVREALRIPHKDTLDVALAAAFIPSLIYTTLRVAWSSASWMSALRSKMTGRNIDLWAAKN